MKAILVREFGGPEVLKLEEVPTPKPAAAQVLVRIHARGHLRREAAASLHSGLGCRGNSRSDWRWHQKSEAGGPCLHGENCNGSLCTIRSRARRTSAFPARKNQFQPRRRRVGSLRDRVSCAPSLGRSACF